MKCKLKVVLVEDASFEGDNGNVEMWKVMLADSDQRLATPFSIKLMRPKVEDVKRWQDIEGQTQEFELVGTLKFNKDGSITPGRILSTTKQATSKA